jgi:predicted short-subunit dehydrogenase-like oxidoreductase (DUF2520 family)
MAAYGPENVLTGPAARGDLHTIERHDEALRLHFPHYRSTYIALVEQTIEIAGRSGQLAPERARQLLEGVRAVGRQID